MSPWMHALPSNDPILDKGKFREFSNFLRASFWYWKLYFVPFCEQHPQIHGRLFNAKNLAIWPELAGNNRKCRTCLYILLGGDVQGNKNAKNFKNFVNEKGTSRELIKTFITFWTFKCFFSNGRTGDIYQIEHLRMRSLDQVRRAQCKIIWKVIFGSGLRCSGHFCVACVAVSGLYTPFRKNLRLMGGAREF